MSEAINDSIKHIKAAMKEHNATFTTMNRSIELINQTLEAKTRLINSLTNKIEHIARRQDLLEERFLTLGSEMNRNHEHILRLIDGQEKSRGVLESNLLRIIDDQRKILEHTHNTCDDNVKKNSEISGKLKMLLWFSAILLTMFGGYVFTNITKGGKQNATVHNRSLGGNFTGHSNNSQNYPNQAGRQNSQQSGEILEFDIPKIKRD